MYVFIFQETDKANPKRDDERQNIRGPETDNYSNGKWLEYFFGGPTCGYSQPWSCVPCILLKFTFQVCCRQFYIYIQSRFTDIFQEMFPQKKFNFESTKANYLNLPNL